MSCLNRVMLLGTISKYGVEVRYANTGTACASFQLVIEERGHDGKLHPTFISVEIWGRRAEEAGEHEAGELCLVEGKLAKKKRGDAWELIVQSFELQPLALPVAKEVA